MVTADPATVTAAATGPATATDAASAARHPLARAGMMVATNRAASRPSFPRGREARSLPVRLVPWNAASPATTHRSGRLGVLPSSHRMTKPAEPGQGGDGSGCLETLYTLFLVCVAWVALNRLWSPVFVDLSYHERMDRRLVTWLFFRHCESMVAMIPAYLVARWLLFRKMRSLALRPVACVLVAVGTWQAVHARSWWREILPHVEESAASYWEERTEWMLQQRARELEREAQADSAPATEEPSAP